MADVKLTPELLKDTYNKAPLKITVSFWAAFLTNRMYVYTHERSWSPAKGVVVDRGLTHADHPDHEEFECEKIVKAGQPHIDYVWFVDWVRAFQLWYNMPAKVLARFGLDFLPVWPPWDGPGDAKFIAGSGRDTLVIECVNHASRVSRLITQYSRTIQGEADAKKKAILDFNAEQYRRTYLQPQK